MSYDIRFGVKAERSKEVIAMLPSAKRNKQRMEGLNH